MMMLIVRALHIIFVITWFSGLFYLGRLFVYYRDAQDKDPETCRILQTQFRVMMQKLYQWIVWPSSVIVIILGLQMAGTLRLMSQSWFHTKLLLVLGLVIYQCICGFLLKQTHNNAPLKGKSIHFRLFNEIPTLFLFAIVFTVIFHQSSAALIGLGTALGFTLGVGLILGCYRFLKTRLGSNSPPKQSNI